MYCKLYLNSFQARYVSFIPMVMRIFLFNIPLYDSVIEDALSQLLDSSANRPESPDARLGFVGSLPIFCSMVMTYNR